MENLCLMPVFHRKYRLDCFQIIRFSRYQALIDIQFSHHIKIFTSVNLKPGNLRFRLHISVRFCTRKDCAGLIDCDPHFIFYSILPQPHRDMSGQPLFKQAWEGVVKALKCRSIWLVSFNIFLVYSVYCGLTYFIPFLEDAYALPATLVGVYGIINQYGLKMVGGPVGGFLADKALHSTTKYLRIGFVIVAIILGIFSFLPHESMGIAAGMTITLCISACVYSMRAVYFAPMDEVSVPREITGSAMSMASFIGYLPGAFMYAVYGGILDSFSGLSGYRIVFIIMTVFAVCGVLLSTFIVRKLVKKN